MGFAKYHEDNIKIYDDRMYYHFDLENNNVNSNYTYIEPQIKYKYYCPFCRTGVMTISQIVEHVLTNHGNVHEFVYVNNRKMSSNEQSYKNIHSLKIYSFRNSPIQIKIEDSINNEYILETKEGIFEYDIQSIIPSQIFSEIHISNIDNPVRIKQNLDINLVSLEKMIKGVYCSILFDDQISEELLSVDEYLIYEKMLIYEGEDTESFIDRIGYMDIKASSELDELYFYHYLNQGKIQHNRSNEIDLLAEALLCIFNGKTNEASDILETIKGKSNNKLGLMLIVNLLKNDKLAVDFLKGKYEQKGIVGTLERVLYHFCYYEKEHSDFLVKEMNELKLFKKYPLMRAIIELIDSINNRRSICYESYKLLRELTPLASINYCYGIDDDSIKEKILKSMIKLHKESSIIKEYAFKNDYSWMKRRIFVSDGELYRRAVKQKNAENKINFSDEYLDSFPYDDKVQIKPLGGEKEIGASCFVISYGGYNIMIDCGIDPKKTGDDAYPLLDLWDGSIDAILVSHAHIDHCGGVPKAHAMWPDAKIITTGPTKVFMKYVYLDMARVKNGINDEFEIENVNIEKEVMYDTLQVINTVSYDEWIKISDAISIRFHLAGHIVGAAMIEINIDGKEILYTGDYCNYNQILSSNFNKNKLPKSVDYLITESTYMRKESIDWQKQYGSLKREIINAVSKGHAVLLPSTAIGRSQELVCLIGEMKLSKEIPEDTPLYLAGLAIPATTQIIPFMNKRYEKIVGLFTEFDRDIYPEDNAIVIASSATMSKGSASYKIANHWKLCGVRYDIIANGFVDDDFETGSFGVERFENITRHSLSTHVDLRGIFDLIDYVSPKVISFVHRGSNSLGDYFKIVERCKKVFANDIICRELTLNKSNKIFDMYEWLMEGEN